MHLSWFLRSNSLFAWHFLKKVVLACMGSTILENDFEHFRSKLSLFWPRNGGFARSAAAVLDHRILKISGKNVYFLFTGPLDTIIKFAKKCLPLQRGAHFRFSSFFIKSHWKRKSNMPPPKKWFPLLWGAHFWFSRISTSSQSWCTSIVPFSKMILHLTMFGR